MSYTIMDNTPENENKLRHSGWGHEKIEVSFEDWKAVMQGKALGINDGEYTHYITVDKTSPTDASFWEKMFIKKENECELLRKQLKTVLDENKQLKRL